jgi:PAS domain S-box-containing protein
LAETARAFEGKRVQVEKHFSKNGKEYWFERHINPYPQSAMEWWIRVALWSIDITDRKKAEEALRESEAKFRKLGRAYAS